MKIENLKSAIQQFLDVLKLADSTHEQLQSAYTELVAAVEDAWTAYQNKQITVTDNSLPVLMHSFITLEMPALIATPENIPEIQYNLRRYLRVMDTVVQPREQG